MIKYWYKQKKKREKVEKGASYRPENDTVSEINKIKEKLIRVDKDSKGGQAPLGHASSLSLSLKSLTTPALPRKQQSLNWLSPITTSPIYIITSS